MPRLGSLVLAGILLGVPRALDSRAFGAQRTLYVETSQQAPELTAFAAALERALGASPWQPAARRGDATVVVDVLNVASAEDTHHRRMEAISLVVRDRRGPRRLVLHGSPQDREASALLLLEQLDAFGA
jgi:hypothetical protein